MAMCNACRYWRETLISNSESWCFISGKNPDLLLLSLERSGSYPLEVELSADTLFSYAIWDIRPHIHRLASLRCRIEETDPLFLQTFSQLDQSPIFHTLSIGTDRAPTVDPQDIEIGLVSGDMPSLRTLELLPFPIIPQFVQFKHLTSLQLDILYSNLTDVLDLLAANPSLEKVRLLGNFENSEDEREAGSIFLEHLRFLTVEKCTTRTFLEKLTLPRDTRMFVHYNIISHIIPSTHPLPQSMREYANLQGLTSLWVLFYDETYIDATGLNGSVALKFMDRQDASFMCNAIDSLPATDITRLLCEFHPALTPVEIDKVKMMMDMLPHLEEIVLAHFDERDVRRFLSTLTNTSGWKKLLRLKFVHCRQLMNWFPGLIQMVAERMDRGLGLDIVTVVYVGEERSQELFDVLRGFVGRVEEVEVGIGEVIMSEPVWDDANCTTRLTSVPM